MPITPERGGGHCRYLGGEARGGSAGFVYLCVTMMAMIPTESVQEQCVQALALQLAGLRSPEINTLLGTLPVPDELPLELPSGLALYEQELQRYGEEAEAILGRCAELGIGVHPSSSTSYPSALRSRLGGQCPPLLYTLGMCELLEEHRRGGGHRDTHARRGGASPCTQCDSGARRAGNYHPERSSSGL